MISVCSLVREIGGTLTRRCNLYPCKKARREKSNHTPVRVLFFPSPPSREISFCSRTDRNRLLPPPAKVKLRIPRFFSPSPRYRGISCKIFGFVMLDDFLVRFDSIRLYPKEEIKFCHRRSFRYERRIRGNDRARRTVNLRRPLSYLLHTGSIYDYSATN